MSSDGIVRQSDDPAALKLELAHVLLMDIVGYSLLSMERQHELISELKQLVRDAPEFARSQNADDLIRLPTGDGMALAFFGDPTLAVCCARHISMAIRDRPHLPLRMGVHTGPIFRIADINANANIAGGGINIAQRVMDCGDAGHILLSKAIAETLLQLDYWRASVHDLGDVEVKHKIKLQIFNLFSDDFGNSATPSKLLSTSHEGATGRTWTRRRFVEVTAAAACVAAGGAFVERDKILEKLEDLLHPIPAKRFVALLTWPPIADGKIKPVLAGVIAAIEDELSRVEALDHDLYVISRKIASDTPASQLNDIRDSMGANLILAASGVQYGNHFQLSLNVSDSSNRSLREKQITCALGQEIFLPEKAVHVAARMLKVGSYLTASQRARRGTQSSDAFSAFQSAETMMKQENDVGLEPAIVSYKEAIDLDPHYALAHAKLALAYCRVYALHRDRAVLDLAGENGETALRLDPRSIEGHRALASVREQRGDEPGALREMAKALSIDPSDPRTLVWQAQLYARLNRWEDAERTFRQVLMYRPNRWLAHNELGVVLSSQAKYAQAMSEFRAASVTAPKNFYAFNNIGTIYLYLGDFENAITNLNQSLTLRPNDLAAANMAIVKQSQGKYKESIPFALKAVEFNPSDSTNSLVLGDCYSLLRGHEGDAKRAYRQAKAVQAEELLTDPTDGPGTMLLALYSAKLGANGEARQRLKESASLPVDDIDSQLYKARTLELLGERDEALSAVAACLKKGVTHFQIESMVDMGLLRADVRYQEISKELSGTSTDS